MIESLSQSLDVILQVWKQKVVGRSHIWTTGRMMQQFLLEFAEEVTGCLREMGRRIVVVKQNACVKPAGTLLGQG